MKYFTLLLSFFALGALNAQIVDPGFEAGTGSGVWGEASTNFGTPLCDASCGAATDIYSGSWVVWFGGVGAEEIGAVTQNINIPSGNEAELSFWFKIAEPGPGLDVDGVIVEIDDQGIWSANCADDSTAYADWTQVTIDISSYADGGTHSLGMTAYQTTAQLMNIFADEFSLSVDGNTAVNIDEQLNQEAEVTVYPNPASDVLNFQFGMLAEGTAFVRMYNLNGQLVLEDQLSNINNMTYPLNVEAMEAGLYLTEVTVNGNTTTQRVMVQH